MLTKFHKILLGALAAQILVAILLFARSSDRGAAKEQQLLAAFDAAKVTRVQVFANSADKAGVDLGKRGGAWVLTSHFDHPVDATKVTTALEPIGKLAGSKPVATSTSRHGQLRVADQQFEKKVVLSVEGGQDITLYFGASAGLRRNALRIGGQDRVWGVAGMSSTTIGETPGAWIDTTYYKATEADIAKLVVKSGAKAVTMERVVAGPPPPAAGSGSAAPPTDASSESWQVTIDGAPVKLADGETIDVGAIESRLSTISSLTMRAPGDPKRDASKPTATIEVHKKGAAAPDVLEVVADGDSYWVHQQGSPRAAIVDGFTIKDVLEVDRDKLVKKPEPADADAAGPPSGLPPGFELPPGFAPQ